MTAMLLAWGPPLTLTYGLTLADLRSMSLVELYAYVEFRTSQATQ